MFYDYQEWGEISEEKPILGESTDHLPIVIVEGKEYQIRVCRADFWTKYYFVENLKYKFTKPKNCYISINPNIKLLALVDGKPFMVLYPRKTYGFTSKVFKRTKILMCPYKGINLFLFNLKTLATEVWMFFTH